MLSKNFLKITVRRSLSRLYLSHTVRLTICFLLWSYNSMCPVCEAASLWAWALVLSVYIVCLGSCSLRRAFVCQALSAAEMFGVNPFYTTAPFSFWCRWTWAPKSMRKGQLDCDGPHFKRPKEWEEEGGERARCELRDYICGFFFMCTQTYTQSRGVGEDLSLQCYSLASLERERDWRLYYKEP